MSPSSSTNCFDGVRGGSQTGRWTNLALLEDTINLSPPRVTSLKFDTSACEASPQRIGGFPGIVMGDLAVDMMGDVSLRNTMGAGGSDPGHDRTKVTK